MRHAPDNETLWICAQAESHTKHSQALLAHVFTCSDHNLCFDYEARAPAHKWNCVNIAYNIQGLGAVPSNWEEIRGAGLPPAEHGFIKDFSSDQLSEIAPEYLRFINPSDLRVVPDTCGRCHREQAATVPTSVMGTARRTAKGVIQDSYWPANMK